MPKQIEVLVEDLSKDDNGQPTELYGTVRTLTYKAFKFLNSNPENPRYKLLGEVDGEGNLVPGNPNLEAQHRVYLQKSVAPAVETGQISESEEVRKLKAEIERLKANQSPTVENPVVKDEPIVGKAKVTGVGRGNGRGKKLNTVAEVVA